MIELHVRTRATADRHGSARPPCTDAVARFSYSGAPATFRRDLFDPMDDPLWLKIRSRQDSLAQKPPARQAPAASIFTRGRDRRATEAERRRKRW
jgi:hypothetical protein